MTNPQTIDGGAAFNADHQLSFQSVTIVNTGALAANTRYSVPVPTTEMWEIIYFHATITCDATVATRYPFLQVNDVGGTDIILIPNQFTAQWVASISERTSWIRGRNRDVGTNSPCGGVFTNASHMPHKLLVDAGQTFICDWENRKAGDVLSNYRLVYRKYVATARKLANL